MNQSKQKSDALKDALHAAQSALILGHSTLKRLYGATGPIEFEARVDATLTHINKAVESSRAALAAYEAIGPEEPAWIPLSGPGGRSPTEEDASDNLRVYAFDERNHTKHMFYVHDIKNGWTHWAPIPKSPPKPRQHAPTEPAKPDVTLADVLDVLVKGDSEEQFAAELVIKAEEKIKQLQS